jgi:predicted DNA-binding transcriptional regulator AlpA
MTAIQTMALTDLSQALGISRFTLGKWIKKGWVPTPRKIGLYRVFDVPEVCDAIERNQLAVAPYAVAVLRGDDAALQKELGTMVINKLRASKNQQ